MRNMPLTEEERLIIEEMTGEQFLDYWMSMMSYKRICGMFDSIAWNKYEKSLAVSWMRNEEMRKSIS